MVDATPTLAVGIDLTLVRTEDGGRAGPVLSVPGKSWSYRPNWGLPSTTPPEQRGAPVLGFSRSEVWPGESARAVIIPLFPEVVPRWRAEVVPGVLLPMYEGGRVCGYGRVLWVGETTRPLPRKMKLGTSDG